MKISVSKYTLEPRTADGGTAGSHGLESLEFQFSPEWNDLFRTVTFFPPKSVAKCVSFTGDSVPLPPEVTARAGKTAYVLCGAKDGVTIITLTGAIEVAETLIPTESETEEYTPGALEQATLLCGEARADALCAAASAEAAAAGARAAEGHSNTAAQIAEEVQEMKSEVAELYDDVMEGTAVHAEITQVTRLDSTRAPSVAGVANYIDTLLPVICPFRIRAVNTLPTTPETGRIYLHDGKCKVYKYQKATVTAYKWDATYLSGGGPATLYTYSQNFKAGDVLYWQSGTSVESVSDLTTYDTVTEISTEGLVTSYGTLSVEYVEEVSLTTGEVVKDWAELTEDDDLNGYLQYNAASWLITGGTQ